MNSDFDPARSPDAHDTVRAVMWAADHLRLLDQRCLPRSTEYVECRTASAVADAIREMAVRGAPAIGISAAYGVVLAARAAYEKAPSTWDRDMEPAIAELAESRPTAVNLAWALRRMHGVATGLQGDPTARLLAEARSIHEEDVAANRRMGELGAALIERRCAVLTHCNTGSLATGGYGTALGVIRSAYGRGRLIRVYADETRPWLQGARLTAWELVQDRIPVTLLADAAAPLLMRRGAVDWVIVGADRITANGDVANKIGTYGLSIAARAHGVRFMVVAPLSTIDRSLETGDLIPIESRTEEELFSLQGRRLTVEGVEGWNPVFDVTPAENVDVLVTERGVVRRPDRASIAALFDEYGPAA